jgi:periplasmic divalent cation tolerance protein
MATSAALRCGIRAGYRQQLRWPGRASNVGAVEATAAVVMTTVSSDEDADALAADLVGGRLAACVQRLLIRSTYRWDGEVVTEPEVLLLVKTTSDRVDAVVEHLEANHPYEVPEILVVGDVEASAPYLAWIAGEAGAPSGELP